MKKVFSLLLALAVVLETAPGALALWDPAAAGVEMSAEAVWLENLDTGTILWQQNAEQVRSPASLTKMMTALLFAESGADLNETFTIPEEMQRELDLIQEENGVDVDLKVGERITLGNLLYATMLPSANDAASALGWYLSGGDLDAFAARMNERALQLGCTATSFNCAHGLHEEVGTGNWSTAHDLAVIAKACAANPLLTEVISTPRKNLPMTNIHTKPRIIWKDTVLEPGEWLEMRNSNAMLHPENACYRPYIRGIKTGYTTPAGRCLATTAITDTGNYLLVYLGVEDGKDENGEQIIYGEVARLLDWVTETFSVAELAEAVQPQTLPLLDCPDGTTAILRPEGSVVALRDGDPQVIYTLRESLQAPLRDGEKVGTAEITVNGEIVGTVDMVVDGDYRYSKLLHYKNKVETFFRALFHHGL